MYTFLRKKEGVHEGHPLFITRFADYWLRTILIVRVINCPAVLNFSVAV
jgi:hypothetical protein